MSRIKVEATYRDQTTVELVKDDGSVYMTLREGEPFRIDNQMRTWTPVRVPRKSGKGTVLECRKYRDDGTVLDSFVVPNHKVGLWATSSGSARNGVFHRYKAPKDELDVLCAEVGFYGFPKDIDVLPECRRKFGIYARCVWTDYELERSHGDHASVYDEWCHEIIGLEGIASIDTKKEGSFIVAIGGDENGVWYKGSKGRENALRALKEAIDSGFYF